MTRETVNLDAGYSYIYDKEGNRTKRYVAGTPNTDVTEYEWDHRNRLVKITHYATEGEAADWIIEYAYDHGNRWIRKVLDSDADLTADSSTIFVYDGNQIGLQFDENDDTPVEAADLSHRYVYGPGTDQIIADEQVISLGATGTVLWPLGDHLNTVRDVVNNSATVVLHRVYNAFGKITDASSAIYSLHAFTARPFDQDSDLQNNLNRWYDADTGRWLSEDPIGFGAGDANLYRYVGNNATNTIDPNGLWEIERQSFLWHAFATTEDGDTIRSLADEIGLNADEADKWITGDFSWIRPKQVDETFSKDCMLQIPNVILAFWHGDFILDHPTAGKAARIAIQWDQDVQYLKDRGFFVREQINDVPASAWKGKDFLGQLKHVTQEKYLHGVFLWSHGAPNKLASRSGKWEVSHADVVANLEYKLGVALLNACYTDFKGGEEATGKYWDYSGRLPVRRDWSEMVVKGGRDWVSSSENAIFAGRKRTLYPLGIPDFLGLLNYLGLHTTDFAHPSQYIPAGKQGTN